MRKMQKESERVWDREIERDREKNSGREIRFTSSAIDSLESVLSSYLLARTGTYHQCCLGCKSVRESSQCVRVREG